jgi:hypothetical protein
MHFLKVRDTKTHQITKESQESTIKSSKGPRPQPGWAEGQELGAIATIFGAETSLNYFVKRCQTMFQMSLKWE